MKIIKYVLVLAVVMAAAAVCFGADKPTPTKRTKKQIIAEANNRFALELYAKLRAREGNLFCSPYSISTALAMAYAGARGETETQMAKVLHFPVFMSTDANRPSTIAPQRDFFHSAFGAVIKDLNARGKKGAYQLTVANALWGQKGYGFLEEFLELTDIHYGGALNEVDFVTAAETARKTINDWVEKQTRKKIKKLIQPGVLDSLTRLVLTNAIYFKGNWARQFKKDNTRNAPFTLSKGDKLNVPMMNQTAEFKYFKAEDFQALELPYVDNELSMIILLPRQFDGLKEFEKKLTLKNLSGWLAKLRKREVIVSVPKFKMTSQFGLAGALKSMGMADAFSPGADFSAMTGKKELFISAVIHKAYVDVNEEGTEAAAATAVTMKLTAVMPGEPPVFRADHPFLFLIRDNQSGGVLFIGRVTNPKQ